MSRSNPTANNPNPSQKWLEWKGSTGILMWYDKEKKENFSALDKSGKFTFLVLDQLSTITGYNKKAKSGIHSNEVRDARADVMIVKYFSGDVIAEGLWKQIKEKVVFHKGGFAASIYIAYKEGGELKIGNIRASGCALGPWFDFVKKHRADLDKKAVTMKAGKRDTSGNVEFTPPEFTISDITEETNLAAIELDRQLQVFLDGYMKRTKLDQVNQTPEHRPEDEDQDTTDYSQHEPEPTNERPPSRGGAPAPGRRPPKDPDLDAPEDDIPF